MTKKNLEVTIRPANTFGEKAAVALRRIGLDVKGQPYTEITLARTGPDEFQKFVEASQQLLTDKDEPAADASTIPVITKFAIHPKMKEWARIVRQTAQDLKIDIDDLWVLIAGRPEAKALSFSTNLGSLTLGWRDPREYSGKLKAFVRFKPFAVAVFDKEAPEFAVVGNALSYVVDGRRSEIPIEKKVGSGLRPVEVPVNGYVAVRNLGIALREAANFVETEPDSAGLEQVYVRKHVNGAGKAGDDMVDVVAVSHRAVYRRTIAFQKFENEAFLRMPKTVQAADVLLDHMHAINGRSTTWLHNENGIVIGLENETATHDIINVDELLAAPPARTEFTFDELNAVRRGVSQARMEPIVFRERVRTIALTPQKHGLLIRGEKGNMKVDCSGRPGPEVFMDEQDLGAALMVRGIESYEFDPGDANKPVRLAGPQVAVTLSPYKIA